MLGHNSAVQKSKLRQKIITRHIGIRSENNNVMASINFGENGTEYFPHTPIIIRTNNNDDTNNRANKKILVIV